MCMHSLLRAFNLKAFNLRASNNSRFCLFPEGDPACSPGLRRASRRYPGYQANSTFRTNPNGVAAFLVELLILPLLAAPLAFAHPESGDYLQHRIELSAKADHVDLTIEITFDAGRSYEERQKIDADKDGKFSKAERKIYLDRVDAEAGTQLQLTINGKAVMLVPLYDPELDLYDSRDVERHPHVLRLSYFAEVTFAPGDVVTVVDNLWPDEPAIMLAEAGEGETVRITPRQPKVPGVANRAPNTREVVFDSSSVDATAIGKTGSGHVCGAACRHRSGSKGRPAQSGKP